MMCEECKKAQREIISMDPCSGMSMLKSLAVFLVAAFLFVVLLPLSVIFIPLTFFIFDWEYERDSCRERIKNELMRKIKNCSCRHHNDFISNQQVSDRIELPDSSWQSIDNLVVAEPESSKFPVTMGGELGTEITSQQDLTGCCEVCGEAFNGQKLIYCQSCRTPHHEDCWEYNGGCSIYACRSKVATPS